MKSAYELAMDRLNASDPEAAGPLTAEQKRRLAEIDQRHKAKMAEREIFLKQQIAAAEKPEDVEKLREQLRRERAVLAEECEDEKNRIRREGKK
jgi:hypothetical protein